MAENSQLGNAQLGNFQLGASGNVSASFGLSPSATHTLGAQTITATFSGVDSPASDPFSEAVAFASISGYAKTGANTATFSLNVTSLGGVIAVSDTTTSTSQNITAAAVVPEAPTSPTIANNGDGTVTVNATQPADNGGAAVTSNSVLLSTGQTASGTLPITLAATVGASTTAQVLATNSVGDGPYSGASSPVTPTNPNVVSILMRCPYLSTDTIGTKSVQLYGIVAGVLTAIGSAITTGFYAIPNVTNGWNVLLQVTPNGAFGDFAGIAVFSNINGSEKAAVEVYSPPTSSPSALVQCKIAPFRAADTIGTPGYQLYSSTGAAIGSRVTAGILPVSGVTNGYVARISLTPDALKGFQGSVLWDG